MDVVGLRTEMDWCGLAWIGFFLPASTRQGSFTVVLGTEIEITIAWARSLPRKRCASSSFESKLASRGKIVDRAVQG